MRKTVIGIYEEKIFLVEGNDINNVRRGIEGKPIFCVLRPVSKEQLEEYRDDDDIREYVEDIWKEAVMSGDYEGSLDDYVEEVKKECGMEDDEEAYPGKDDSWTEYIYDEVREQADNFIKKNCGYEVGTWEVSGSYEPGHRSEFTGFDFVFPTPEAQAFAEAYEKERGI